MEAGGTVSRVPGLSRRRPLGREEIGEVLYSHAPSVHQCPCTPADTFDQRPDRRNRESTAILCVEVGLIEAVGSVAVAVLAHPPARDPEQDVHDLGVDEAVQL